MRKGVHPRSPARGTSRTRRSGYFIIHQGIRTHYALRITHYALRFSMPTSLPLRLVCFDLGRVLVRICDDWPQACRLAGVEMPVVRPASPESVRFHELIVALDVGRIRFDQFVADAAPLLHMTPAQA